MVNTRFLGCLGCTGVAAALVLLYPAIAFGLMMGTVPGVLLGLAPALFIYLLAWWGLRWIVLKLAAWAGFDMPSRRVRWISNFAAIALAIMLGSPIPLAINAPLEQQTALLQATDVQPAGTVKLPATVALELPRVDGGSQSLPYCEAICLRLLYNGVASRVIAAEILPDGNIGPASSYRVERRDTCPTPDLPKSLIVWPGEWRPVGDGKPVGFMDRVRARISAGDCLLREAGRIDDAEAVISLREITKGVSSDRSPWILRLETMGARRLEIIQSGGNVLCRQTEVTTEPLIVPLMPIVVAGSLTTATYTGWARYEFGISPVGPGGRDILPDLLGEAARSPDLPGATRP